VAPPPLRLSFTSIIPTSVSDEDAKKKYPQGFRTVKPYLRVVAAPQ
jgi:thioredoxin-dependent peroxiredoxin